MKEETKVTQFHFVSCIKDARYACTSTSEQRKKDKQTKHMPAPHELRARAPHAKPTAAT